MGILNVTPDSFSDGGSFLDPGAATARGLAMIAEGADILDIGGESTRPGYQPIADSEQVRRIVPVIERLRRADPNVAISVDTTRAMVARAALDAGADWLNDTSGLLGDSTMASLVAERGCSICLMHRFDPPRRSEPVPSTGRTMMRELIERLSQRIDAAQRAGVERDHIVIDPGMGFGTVFSDNLDILAHLGELRRLALPTLVGPSRKSFLGQLTGKAATERIFATAAAVTVLALSGTEVIRVHDVAAMADVVKVAFAIRCTNQAAS